MKQKAKEEEEVEVGIYSFDIDCVELARKDMLAKHPSSVHLINKSLSDIKQIPNISSEKAQELIDADQLLLKYAEKIQNQPYSEQRQY